MSEATLVVSRTLPADVGQRQVYVELDGERIATLLNGESVTRTIAAGPHRLRFDNTRLTSMWSTGSPTRQDASHCPSSPSWAWHRCI
jgi:hypothetical protein